MQEIEIHQTVDFNSYIKSKFQLAQYSLFRLWILSVVIWYLYLIILGKYFYAITDAIISLVLAYLTLGLFLLIGHIKKYSLLKKRGFIENVLTINENTFSLRSRFAFGDITQTINTEKISKIKIIRDNIKIYSILNGKEQLMLVTGFNKENGEKLISGLKD
ncbi:hypothetical protein KC614_04905, partial [candidate division WWE3 bacterium]|nr:hypothetical protein [candidate division WWE3 bacterium]